MKPEKHVGLVFALCAMTMVTGCATVANGKFQRIEIKSRPPGATVALFNGSVRQNIGTTPASITLPRTNQPFYIVLDKPGYSSTDIQFIRKTSPFVFWNVAGLIFGGVPAVAGVLIDLASSSFWTFEPVVIGRDASFATNALIVTMAKDEGSPEAQLAASTGTVGDQQENEFSGTALQAAAIRLANNGKSIGENPVDITARKPNPPAIDPEFTPAEEPGKKEERPATPSAPVNENTLPSIL